jgi:hypothetical protein
MTTTETSTSAATTETTTVLPAAPVEETSSFDMLASVFSSTKDEKKTERLPRYRQTCTFHSKKSKCKNGDKCEFIHVECDRNIKPDMPFAFIVRPTEGLKKALAAKQELSLNIAPRPERAPKGKPRFSSTHKGNGKART